MQWTSLALALLAQGAKAQNMLRFACSQLSIERLDPLVTPGANPSPHLHQIVGGNSFNASMPVGEHDLAAQSTCTSCTFSEDFSNYWTAMLFYRARNGSFHRVPTVGNGGPQGQLVQNLGMDIYYIPPYTGGSVTAFKPGFRMIAGDPLIRKSTKGQMQPGICHRCFPRNQNPFGGAPCTGSDTTELPTQPCDGGIRATITFPTCWNGKDLDTPNHKDHMAYPQGGFGGFGGSCPSTHPVQVPQIMYELLWDTSAFNNKADWPADGSQPFVYSFGDGSGNGQHGDYMFGWKGNSLQKAMDSRCNLNTCSQTPSQTAQQAMQCTKPQSAKEQVDGWLPELPGKFQITY